MALRLSLGQYFDARSPMHRMDPRAKIGCALVCMVSVFAIHTPAQLALGFAFVGLSLALSKVPARQIVRSVTPLAAMLVLLALFNLLLTREGTTLVQWGPVVITSGGVRAALLYSTRLVIGVLAAALILATTTPAQLTDAADSLLSPLTRLGLPGHELAMVFSLMLRFIPTIADEASAIIDAQTARGGAIGEGSLPKRVRAVVPVIVSLLASSVMHANDLSRALDARCYEGGATRSHWHPLHMRAFDWGALVVTVGYVCLLVYLGSIG